MVKKMNKQEFLKELGKKLGFDEEKCVLINDIIEDTSIIGKKNKEKMVEGFKEKIGLSEEEANKVYETAMGIIGSQIKEKLKHPFKSQD